MGKNPSFPHVVVTDPVNEKGYVLKIRKTVVMDIPNGILVARAKNLRLAVFHYKEGLACILVQTLTPALAPAWSIQAMQLTAEIRRFRGGYLEMEFTFPDRFLFAFLTAIEMAKSQSFFRKDDVKKV